MTQMAVRSVASDSDICGSKPCASRSCSRRARSPASTSLPVFGTTGLHQSRPQPSRSGSGLAGGRGLLAPVGARQRASRSARPSAGRTPARAPSASGRRSQPVRAGTASRSAPMRPSSRSSTNCRRSTLPASARLQLSPRFPDLGRVPYSPPEPFQSPMPSSCRSRAMARDRAARALVGHPAATGPLAVSTL